MSEAYPTPAAAVVSVYALSDPRSGALRYVGQSTNPKKRLNKHLRAARVAPVTPRDLWLRELLNAGLQPVLSILEECAATSWQERERHWIGLHRDAGTALLNDTDGGAGVPNPSPETRARIAAGVSRALKGKPLTEEHRANISTALRGQAIPAETRAKMLAARKGKLIPPEVRAKMAESHRGRKKCPEHAEKTASARRQSYVFTSPAGEEFEVVGLALFCREHGLQHGNMSGVLNGRLKDSKGWTVRRA